MYQFVSKCLLKIGIDPVRTPCLDHHKMTMISKGTCLGVGLEGAVLKCIPAYDMLVSTMATPVTN